MPTTHVVKNGENLSSIAEKYGFHDWRVLYDAPENAPLRAQRPNPSLIVAGDKVIIPEKTKKTAPVASGKPATFKALPPVPLDPVMELFFVDKNDTAAAIPKLVIKYATSSGKSGTRAVSPNGRTSFLPPYIKDGDTVDISDIRDSAEVPDIRYGEFALKGLSINTTHIIKIPDKRKIINRIATKLGITRRAGWGARAPKLAEMDQDWDFEMIVIHHSGNSGEKDPKKIQDKHMDEKGYDDIAYQYIVLPNGSIAEGRYLAHKGAANAAVNTGKIGILVAGDFEPGVFDPDDDEPTSAQLTSTRALIDALKAEFSTIKKLVGHRDIKTDTECPGTEMYKHIPDLRAKTGLAP